MSVGGFLCVLLDSELPSLPINYPFLCILNHARDKCEGVYQLHEQNISIPVHIYIYKYVYIGVFVVCLSCFVLGPNQIAESCLSNGAIQDGLIGPKNA